NMRVKRGEFVALAGPVGSGKTTLVNLLAGLERASSGSIQVLGKETTRLSGRELTALRLASLGLVPQVQNLMQEFTVSQNVEMLRGDNALRAKTLIIATHDKRIIELATRTVRMNAKIQA